MHLGAVFRHRLSGLCRGQFRRGAVFVGGAEKQHLVAAAALIASVEIGRKLAADQVAEMLDPVDVGNGRGDQVTGHGCALLQVSRVFSPWPEQWPVTPSAFGDYGCDRSGVRSGRTCVARRYTGSGQWGWVVRASVSVRTRPEPDAPARASQTERMAHRRRSAVTRQRVRRWRRWQRRTSGRRTVRPVGHLWRSHGHGPRRPNRSETWSPRR